MVNFHNPEYAAGIPIATGDRYYAQDLMRDLLSVMNEANRALAQSVKPEFDLDNSDKVVIRTDGFIQGISDQLGVSTTVAVVSALFDVPNSFAALPPTVTQVAVALKIDWRFASVPTTGAVLDGVTDNYVFLGVELNPLAGKTRARAKAAGTYEYEAEWRSYFRLSAVDPTPARNELYLGYFSGTSGGTWTVVNEQDAQNLTGLYREYAPGLLIGGQRYRPNGRGEYLLPTGTSEGSRIEIIIPPSVAGVRITQSANQMIFRDYTSATILGATGYFDTRPGQRLELVKVGEGGRYQAPAKITNPATLPPSTGVGTSWSPNGRYLAVGHSTTPRVTIYDWVTGAPVKIADPAVLPTGTGQTGAWSPDGRYLAVAHDITPFVTIYDWSSGVPVKITDPATLPIGTGRSPAWSPDGRYFAVAHTTTPFVTIYDWVTGAPVKITDPATLPAGAGNSPSWSPDGRYLAVAHDTTPFVTIYDWSSGVPVKITDPATLPTGTGRSPAWSPDGRYFAVAHSVTPFVTIYDWTTGVPIKITNPATLPTGIGYGVSWSPNGRYLAAGHTTTPFITIYDVLQIASDGWLLRVTDGPKPTRFDFNNATP